MKKGKRKEKKTRRERSSYGDSLRKPIRRIRKL